MPEKKQESFTVTDRRLFNSDGEARTEIEKEPVSELTSTPQPAPAAAPVPAAPAPEAPEPEAASGVSSLDPEMPPTPTAREQQEQHDAYRKSSKDLDTRVELSGHSAKELEITFERFMASLYMSAMMHLGLMHEQNAAPRVDLIGARQTIDTLGLLQEKTKNNLTSAEQTFLQNCLYELRMAYVEVTNALARAPEPAPGKGVIGQ
jgi:hypothetical protein